MHLVEALRTIGRPGGIDAIHRADDARRREPGDQRQIVGHPFVLQRCNAREFRRLARGEPYSPLGAAALEQTEKWAVAPSLGRLGAAYVRRLFAEGASIAAADVRKAELDEVVSEFASSERVYGAHV